MFSVAVNFCFAHQTDLLSDEQRAAVMRNNSTQLLLGIKVNQHFQLLIDLLESLPLSISRIMMPPGLIDMMELSAVRLPAVQTGLGYFEAESTRGARRHPA